MRNIHATFHSSLLLLLVTSMTSIRGGLAFSSPRRTLLSGERRERRRPSRGSEAGPKSESSARERRRPCRPRKDQEVDAFDPKQLTSTQTSNENALPLDLHNKNFKGKKGFIRRRSKSSILQVPSAPGVIASTGDADASFSDDSDDNFYDGLDSGCKGPEIEHDHIQYLSLDDIFPNLDFSKHFFRDGNFRQSIRVAMRKDIFFTTPAYADLSPKVAAMMLDDDSSLQGTWNCIPKSIPDDVDVSTLPPRMTRLTKVLAHFLGSNAPAGDEFMMAMGGLCGKNPSTHWIDIIGVKDRKCGHSWHQDTGKSYEGQGHEKATIEGEMINDDCRYTVMLGFPIEDNYTGCGVFSHAIHLKHEQLAPQGHNKNEPVLFEGTASEEFVVRPEFSMGKEIIRYRDIDVVHSAPDVVYRQSVMRFM